MKYTIEQLSLVDTPTAQAFDLYTRLATKMLDVPIALVSIVDFARDRQFFTSAIGLDEPWASKRETPLTHSFSQHVVRDNKPLAIEDAREHPLVKDSLAISDIGVIAYLGVPIVGSDGMALGAICAIDTQPHIWSQEDVSMLSDLAQSVNREVALRTAYLDREETLNTAVRLGNIIENSTHEVYTVDVETLKFVSVNKGARQNLGYSLAESQSLTPLDVSPEFDVSNFKALVRLLISGKVDKLEFEVTHKRKDGTTYPASMRLEYHSDANGSVLIGFCEDITERRKLEIALAEESKNFLAFFNYAPEAMSVSGMDTVILQANPACERLFGMTSEALIGEKFINYVPEKYQQEVQLGFSQATPEAPLYSVLMEQVMNGIPKVLVWSNLVQFEGGCATRIFSIGSDVTDFHDAKIRAERSAEEAKRAIEIREVFLANMSHEVRTPLNAIMGLFQLIQMADVPLRQKKQAEVGLNASHHLLAQLVNVLELSRVEANAVEISPKPTNIRAAAGQWFETAEATNHRLDKPIELSLDVAIDTPELFNFDERRVTQIINNLTDNALKFTKEGRVEVRVKPVGGTDPSKSMRLDISVSDTGCGILQDKCEAIFERFVQIDDAQTRENSGSGLGLAISRELAELMGAKLDVISPSGNAGYETTFTLGLFASD